MALGRVNNKELNIEFYYGYLNIHLEELRSAILTDNLGEINTQLEHLNKIRNTLIKLGYFERGSKNDGKRKKI